MFGLSLLVTNANTPSHALFSSYLSHLQSHAHKQAVSICACLDQGDTVLFITGLQYPVIESHGPSRSDYQVAAHQQQCRVG